MMFKIFRAAVARQAVIVPEPRRTQARPPAPPVAGSLPAEAQVFLRVMGEDLSAARDILRGMSPLNRAILFFWTEQLAGLIYEAEGMD